MVRRSILGAHHPLQIILQIPTEKGTGGLESGPDGLFGQSDDFLGYVQVGTIVYMLGEETHDMNMYNERQMRLITSWPVGRE